MLSMCHAIRWFNFSVSGAKGRALTVAITNAGQATYGAEAWEGYQAVASYDMEHFFR